MQNVDNRAFSIMIPPQILWKSDPVIYVWSNYESKGEEEEVTAGLTNNFHVSKVIGYGLMHYNLLCNYRDIP